MKKALLLLSVFVIASSAMSAQYLACSFGDKIGGANWDPANAALELTDGDGDGIYSLTVTLTEDITAMAPSDGWKITDGTWGNTFPSSQNLSFVGTNGEEVTFYCDTNDNSADGWFPSTGNGWTSNHSEFSSDTVTFIGTFNSWTEPGVTPTGTGRYRTTQYTVPTGVTNVEYKVRTVGSWDNYAISASNLSIAVSEGDEVYLNLDSERNRMKASIGTSPVSDWSLYAK